MKTAHWFAAALVAATVNASAMPGLQGQGAQAPVTGTVLEAIDVEAYTYLRVKTRDGEVWSAIPKAEVKKGAAVSLVPHFPKSTGDRTMHHVAKAFAGLLLSAAAVPALAVTFGQPDGNAHPFVGNLLYERPDGYYSCTGTMLSPTVMLTAGHCVEEAGVANVRTWVTFSPDVVINSTCMTRACLNAYLDDPANGWVAGTAVPHPQYDDFAGWPSAPTYDVGIVTFATPISMPTYGELPSLGFLETIRKAATDNFTAVGYGLQGYIKPFYSDAWTRYAGTVKLIEAGSTWTGAGMSAKFTNSPGTGGGTCYGDSGGPIFYANTNVVVAVVSWGRTPCIGVDFNFRTDIPATQDFVDPYL